MPTWSEVRTAAASVSWAGQWTFREGEALYTDGNLVASLRIRVPSQVLNPEGERGILARLGGEVSLELYASDQYGDAYGHFLDSVWQHMWDDPPDLHKTKRLPEGYRKPAPLDFTSAQIADFLKRTMCQTPVSPLWGQYRDYFWEPVVEFDAGPVQAHKGEIRHLFRQDWVSKQKGCPFCGLEEFNSVTAYALRPPDQLMYSEEHYVLCCPRCDRAFECLQSGIVDQMIEEEKGVDIMS